MDTRVAIVSIIVHDKAQVEVLNDLLHRYSDWIIGRLGLPYREKGINIIAIAMDAPQAEISALSGKIGALEGIKAKVCYADKGQACHGS